MAENNSSLYFARPNFFWYNQFEIQGRLITKDEDRDKFYYHSEQRKGTTVAVLTIAVPTGKKRQIGEAYSPTYNLRVTMFGHDRTPSRNYDGLAERFLSRVKFGDIVRIRGYLTMKEWIGKDGSTNKDVQLVASDFVIIHNRGDKDKSLEQIVVDYVKEQETKKNFTGDYHGEVRERLTTEKLENEYASEDKPEETETTPEEKSKKVRKKTKKQESRENAIEAMEVIFNNNDEDNVIDLEDIPM